jgi:aminoglycoside phosphotransferase family enzyme
VTSARAAVSLDLGSSDPAFAPTPAENLEVADVLERVASLLAAQHAPPFRARAYHVAAVELRQLREPLRDILESDGIPGLDALPAVGPSIAAAIHELLTTGQLRLLARLEGRSSPEEVFMTLPGIGEELAHRLHGGLGVETLEELELAAHDGRLLRLPGFGPRRARALCDVLAARLSRSPRSPRMAAAPETSSASSSASVETAPDVATLLAVDASYREQVAHGQLHRIAPQRFNPLQEAWLPVSHTERAGWHFTALFSNSALAHQLAMTHDWVVLHYERDGTEGQCTVVTERRGSLEGQRVVRGREAECRAHHQRTRVPTCEERSAATVRGLRSAAAYPGREARIESIETHMSWVFLTQSFAYKLKKPSCTPLFDYRTLEARRQACETELQLNRRLAANVYLAVVPVSADSGVLRVGGDGGVVDWLVQMRRLHADAMLDAGIARQTVSPSQIEALAALLARFYAAAPRAGMSGPDYRGRLVKELESKRASLELPRYDLGAPLLRAAFEGLMQWLEQHAPLLDARAPLVCEAHGDLRPEHICLETEPVIIDCLDFDRDLRLLDPVSELAFLELECRRLANDWIGRRLSAGCAQRLGDSVPEELYAFYRRYHALMRAAVAAWHLDELGQDLDKWRARAQTYLRLAASTH